MSEDLNFKRNLMEIVSKKPVILIVDDEPDICEMLAKILSREGYVVKIAMSGKETVKEVMAGSVDIVLLDIIMPDQDGIETLRQIKAIRPQIPVIMFTAYVNMSTIRDAMRFGAYDYIAKPFDLESIKKVIKQRLEEQCINS